MRLLIATVARGAVGGVESYLRGIAPGLRARGHRLALACEHRYEPAPASPDPYAGNDAEWCVEEIGVAATLAAARAWAPDLVWIHGLESPALEAGVLELAPALLFAHNYDGTCATGAKFHRWPQPRACDRRMGWSCAPINFTRHCGRLRPAGFAAQWRRQRQRARQLARYRRVIVASRHMEQEYLRQGVLPERLLRLAYPRLGPPPLAPQPRPAPPARVLMLARLTVAKGGESLLRACAAAESRLGRRLHITIAGDGPERPRLQALARTLGLDADFPGWVDPAARQRLLADADLMAVPSLWPEPFAMVGIEGFAVGIPAVAYAVGGIGDWLRPGLNGELASGAPPTVAGLTAALLRALGNPERWERLRQGAFASAPDYELGPYLDRLDTVLAAACHGE